MKKLDVITLFQFINRVKEKESEATSVKFKYRISTILNTISPEITTLKGIEEGIQKILEPYTKERLEIFKKYGKSTEDGRHINILPENSEIASKELNILQSETYKESFETYDKKMEEYYTILEEEVDISIPTLSIDDFPDFVTSNDIDFLIKMKILP